jgi:glycosyltransferase involved in cell wall biosynthesis
VPTLGDRAKLDRLLEALAAQTFDPARWELIVAADAPALDPALVARLASAGARVELASRRAGPGAARNRGAAVARGEWLAFTEDDCAPAPDWLERAAARLDADPSVDVLAGATTKPGGRPVHRQDRDLPLYLPTCLFVRRATFTRAGGYCEAYFDAEQGVYFREDSDFGFALEASGATVVAAHDVRVEHPEEHTGFLDPLRWARRHEMDPLLERRHPEAFRERIEIHRFGPFRVRRPIVRACVAFLIAAFGSAIAALAGSLALSTALLLVAGLALAVVWAKFRFDPRRLPMVPLVPFVLAAALARGHRRARRLAG